MNEFDEKIEPAIRKRFLAAYAKFKEVQIIKDGDFIQSIGYDNKSLIGSLKTGKQKISLQILVMANKLYPDNFDLHYIISSHEEPRAEVPSLQGKNYNQRLTDK